MTAVPDIRENAMTLRRARRYADALPLYRQMWEHNRAECTLWDGWGYALCLKQTGHLSEALDMCRKLYRHDPAFAPARSLYAWCVFLSAMTGPAAADDEAGMLKAAQGIVQLCDPKDAQSPLAPAMLKVAAYYLQRASPNPEQALEWLARLDPALLSAEVRAVATPDGKQMEQASQQEQFFSLRIKALFLQGCNTECALCCREALATLTAFHYDNHLWFRRYLAQSLLRTEQPQEARELYAYILPRRREWFLLKEAGDVCAALGEDKMAAYFHFSAAAECRDPDKAVRLLELLAARFLKTDERDSAKRHLIAAARIRTDRGWKLPHSLLAQAHDCDVDVEGLPKGSIRNDWNELRRLWQQALDRILPPMTGRITRMLPGNKAGFVQADNGQGPFFFHAAQFNGRREQLAEGLAVCFRVESGYDAKKDKVTPNAVGVRVVHNVQ
ncbi:MAG: cold shock domain-containing protein [Saprospiraceae bacterium]|nr:cold shock domain-containing protein [Saprospiraceae bacterium]